MKDVFHAYLLKGARFTGSEELPVISSCDIIPKRVIPFSKMKETKDYDQFVHFYELDEKILPFWNNPYKYLEVLRQFKGVIMTDLSVYRDMPKRDQAYNTYRNRALAFWMQKQGLAVIPNVQFAHEATYNWCFDGLPQHSVIAVGVHGCSKHRNDIKYNIMGLKETIKRLNPSMVVIYGAAPPSLTGVLQLQEVEFVVFPSWTAEVFAKRKREREDKGLFDYSYQDGE